MTKRQYRRAFAYLREVRINLHSAWFRKETKVRVDMTD